MAQRKLKNGDKIQFIRQTNHFEKGQIVTAYGDGKGNFGSVPCIGGECSGILIQGPSAVNQYRDGWDWVFVE